MSRKNLNDLKLAFFILLLIASAAIFLATPTTVEAQGGSNCDQSSDCIKIDNPGDIGSATAPGSIATFIIKAGDAEFHFSPSGGDNGCYSVSFSTTNVVNDTVTWNRYGNGSECQNISHIQLWWMSTPVPPTATPLPTNTPVPPTATPLPTNTPVPPTATPLPTNTPVPPTATPLPTNTPVPPTATPVPPTPTPTPVLIPTGEISCQGGATLTNPGNLDANIELFVDGELAWTGVIPAHGNVNIPFDFQGTYGVHAAYFLWTTTDGNGEVGLGYFGPCDKQQDDTPPTGSISCDGATITNNEKWPTTVTKLYVYSNIDGVPNREVVWTGTIPAYESVIIPLDYNDDETRQASLYWEINQYRGTLNLGSFGPCVEEDDEETLYYPELKINLDIGVDLYNGGVINLDNWDGDQLWVVVSAYGTSQGEIARFPLTHNYQHDWNCLISSTPIPLNGIWVKAFLVDDNGQILLDDIPMALPVVDENGEWIPNATWLSPPEVDGPGGVECVAIELIWPTTGYGLPVDQEAAVDVEEVEELPETAPTPTPGLPSSQSFGQEPYPIQDRIWFWMID